MSLPIYLVHNNLNGGRLFFYTNSGFSQIWYDQIQRFFNISFSRCRQGKLNAFEHVVEGFENLPKTFLEQLEGKSQGKVIVRTG